MFKFKSWLSAAFAALMLAATTASAQTPRVVGGTGVSYSAADLGVGSLRVNGAHSAWAILISPTRAIVPAHALGGALGTYSVLFGTRDRTVTTCSTCVVRTLTAAIRHPSFNSNGTYNNDVAVITFASVPYNTNIQPVTLAQSTDAAPAVGATVLGLASTSTSDPLIHDTNHTVNSVTTTAFVTTPVTPEGAGFMGYNGKVHGMFNYISNPTTQQHTFTRISAFYTWIQAQ